jgi:hypothetical protein
MSSTHCPKLVIYEWPALDGGDCLLSSAAYNYPNMEFLELVVSIPNLASATIPTAAHKECCSDISVLFLDVLIFQRGVAFRDKVIVPSGSSLVPPPLSLFQKASTRIDSP